MTRPILLIAMAATGLAADRFDAASVKVSTGIDSPSRLQFLPGGRFQATAATLARLVQSAYGVLDIQVVGAQGWMNSERFDIAANAEGLPETVPLEQSRRMLQTLLAERFELRIRRDSKEMPVYALVVSKSGAKLTPKGGEPPRPAVAGPVVLRTDSIQGLCDRLAAGAGRLVVDQTGLIGEYNIRVDFVPDKFNGQAPAPEDAGRTIFAAVEKQLGLRLEPRRAPVEMIVIESAERPTGN